LWFADPNLCPQVHVIERQDMLAVEEDVKGVLIIADIPAACVVGHGHELAGEQSVETSDDVVEIQVDDDGRHLLQRVSDRHQDPHESSTNLSFGAVGTGAAWNS